MNQVQLSANQALRPELGIASEILLGVLLLALVYYVKVKLVRARATGNSSPRLVHRLAYNDAKGRGYLDTNKQNQINKANDQEARSPPRICPTWRK
jgi:hypothetical protein